MGTKYCKYCDKIKVASEFSVNHHRKDGLQDYCKSCMKQLLHNWMKANPEKRTENQRAYRISAEGRYDQQKKRGNIRGVEISITKDDFVLWFNSQEKRCYYCGRLLVEYKNGNMRGLTLDRPDNNKPYEIGNIVLCCRRCNTMKGSWLTEGQMLDAARRYFTNEIND